MSLAIIIPAYNEELCVTDTIIEYNSVFPKALIIVVDNNSNDGTFRAAQKCFADNSIKGEVFQESRQGKGYAVNYAFQMIDADYYIMTDADLTYPAREAAKLLKSLIEHRLDVAVGDRISNGEYLKNSSNRLHNFGNKLLSRTVNTLFKTKTKDVFSGLRVFSHRFVKYCPLVSSGFELETEMTINALRYGFRISETPIQFRDRPLGTHSKLRTVKDGFKICIAILKLLKDQKPLIFFGFIGFGSFIFSFLFAIMPLIQFIRDFSVHGVASAVVAVGFAIVGTLVSLHGMTLHTVERAHINVMNVYLKTAYMNNSSRDRGREHASGNYRSISNVKTDQPRFGEEHLYSS